MDSANSKPGASTGVGAARRGRGIGAIEPIDAVYTWVDASDLQWRRQLEHALDLAGSAIDGVDSRTRRYRSHDELRYSLRSLERFAPWVRKIFLVTAGQQPPWLRSHTGRLEMVRHEDIFPDPGVLPTFNSHAIEVNLHRIPGLSRRFLYLNDDLFLGQPCSHTDFLQDEATVTYFERIRLDTDLQQEQPTDRACARTRDKMAAALGGEGLQWMPAHTPQLYDVATILELEERFTEDFARTRAHRFRLGDDFVLRIAHAALAQARNQAAKLLDWGSPDYVFLRMRGNPLMRLRDLRIIGKLRPRFFCLNDDLPVGWRGSLMATAMRAFLQRRFPQPCAFEDGGHAQ